MESQKIINFLESDDDNINIFRPKNGTLLMTKIMDNMIKTQQQNLTQK